MATIGLRDLHIAVLDNDPVSGLPTYNAVEKVVGLIAAKVNPNTSSNSLFYDDGPGDTATTLGEISVDLNVADLPLALQSKLFGHEYVGGILRRKGADNPPYVAIAYRTLKSNGKYRYYWLTKGKFAIAEEDNSTKGDSVEFKTPTTTGAFVKRDCDDQWQIVADEDDPNFTPAMKAAWFTLPTLIAGIDAGNAVVLASGSLGVAGDSSVTGLTSGQIYNIQVGIGGPVFPVLANGTVGASGATAIALTGTSITGLVNGAVYTVTKQ